MRKCPPKFECLPKKLQLDLEKIETAIKLMPKLKEPVLVYRGLRADPEIVNKIIESAEKAKQSGSSFTMPSLTSTSVDPQIAATFGGSGGKKLLFHIKAKSGLAVPEGGYDEDEILQSSKTKYKVVGYHDEVKAGPGYTNIIYLEEE